MRLGEVDDVGDVGDVGDVVLVLVLFGTRWAFLFVKVIVREARQSNLDPNIFLVFSSYIYIFVLVFPYFKTNASTPLLYPTRLWVAWRARVSHGRGLVSSANLAHAVGLECTPSMISSKTSLVHPVGAMNKLGFVCVCVCV